MRKKEYLCDCEIIHEKEVMYVQKHMPKKEILEELSCFYKVIGDPIRVQILMILVIHEMCVCDLAVLLNRTKSAISHQLAILKKHDFVKMKKVGKNVFYIVSDEHIEAILSLAHIHIEERRNK